MQFAHLLGRTDISIFLWGSDPFMPSLFAELSAAFRPSCCCSRAANSSDKIDLADTRQDVMEKPGARGHSLPSCKLAHVEGPGWLQATLTKCKLGCYYKHLSSSFPRSSRPCSEDCRSCSNGVWEHGPSCAVLRGGSEDCEREEPQCTQRLIGNEPIHLFPPSLCKQPNL